MGLLSKLIHAVPDSIFVIDEHGLIRWINKSVTTSLGYTQEDLIGKPVESLIPSRYRRKHVGQRSAHIKKPQPRQMGGSQSVLWALTKSGEEVAVEISLNHTKGEGKTWAIAILRLNESLSQSDIERLHKSESRLNETQAITHTGTWDWDIKTDSILLSDEIYHIYGMEPQHFDNTYEAILNCAHPDEQKALNQVIQQALDYKNSVHFDHRITLSDGKIRQVQVVGVVSRDQQGKPERFLGTVQDITEKTENHKREKLSQIIFERTSDGVAIVDGDTRILQINKAFCVSSGFSEEELMGTKVSLLLPTDQLNAQSCITTLQKSDHWQGELLANTSNGKRYPALVSITKMDDAKSNTFHYIITAKNISDIKQGEKELQLLAHYDHLTQLPNRKLFLKETENALKNVKKSKNCLALLYIDLDGFKLVNDTQGHDIGDQLLREIALKLQSILNGNEIVARLGGDEFAVLVVNDNLNERIEILCKKILGLLYMQKKYSECIIEISASIGVSHYPEDSNTVGGLLRHADQAMYHAKERGRNTYQIYDETRSKLQLQRLQLISDLRKAIDEEQIGLHYQPKLCLKTGLLSGVEALARWHHPRRGNIPPLDFIGVAEDTGLILPIGKQLVENAAIFLANFQGAPNFLPQVALNLSARQLQYLPQYFLIAEV